MNQLRLNPDRSPIHGGDIDSYCREYGFGPEEILDLSTGISPWSWPVPAIPQQVWQSLPYQSESALQAAANYYGCAIKNLLAVAGSQAAIEILPTLPPQQSSVLLPEVGYAEHLYRWQQAGHQVQFYQDLEDLENQVQENQVQESQAQESQVKNSGAQYSVVINPNNPTTETGQPETLLAIAHELGKTGGFLIVDEAFMDATPELSLAAYVDTAPIMVLRSIGKFFGLAGLRLGFVLASRPRIEQVRQQRGLWSVNSVAYWLAEKMFSDVAWIEQQRQRLKQHSAESLAWLQRWVPDLAWQRSATFVSGVGTQQRVEQLAARMMQSGLLVRAFHPLNRPSILRLGLIPEPHTSRVQAALSNKKTETEPS